MSKSIIPSDSQSRQLSLFDHIFDSRIRRHTINNRVHFSILDIFQHYGKAKNPTTSWKTVLKFLEKQGFDSSREILELQFPGERQRKTPVATLDVILRIAQVTEFKEWEPLRKWMAETAHERIEEIADPELGMARAEKRYVDYQRIRGLTKGEALEELQNRRDGKRDFKLMAEAISRVCENINYGQVVNTEYIGLFNAVAADLREVLHTDTIRDALPPLQYSYIRTAEAAIREVMRRADTMSAAQVYAAMSLICKPLGDHLKQVCEILKVDPITGKNLLKG